MDRGLYPYLPWVTVKINGPWGLYDPVVGEGGMSNPVYIAPISLLEKHGSTRIWSLNITVALEERGF